MGIGTIWTIDLKKSSIILSSGEWCIVSYNVE